MLVADFRTAMPAFEAAPDDATVQRHLNRVPLYFDTAAWDVLLNEGIKFWVAHEIVIEASLGATFATAGGASLAIMKKVGSVSVGYSDALLTLQAKNPYMRTTYGQEYWRLVQQVGAGGVAV